MFRAVTALFALGLTTAQTTAVMAAPALDAPSLNGQIQQAAENVCAPLLDSAHDSLLYKKWFADCVTASSAKIAARVAASLPTSTALLPASSDRR